jgi:hypothetical protein
LSEAKTRLLEKIEYLNETIFLPKNLKLSYQSRCSTSWLEIEIIKPDVINIIDTNYYQNNDPNNPISKKIQFSEIQQ